MALGKADDTNITEQTKQKTSLPKAGYDSKA